MLLWFADLMNVTEEEEEVAIHRPNVSTLLSSACCFCFFLPAVLSVFVLLQTKIQISLLMKG